ncbi:hypothetical protein ONZ45_g9488 [Pleurotus djamor]|nr:hypothetical protein ONZ45_g9488 [Pleurotus djamor]
MADFVKDIKVVLQDSWQPPNDCLRDLSEIGEHEVNRGFGGKYVYLIPVFTNSSNDAGTYVELEIDDSSKEGQVDLAAGAGGKYRYLSVIRNREDNKKITSMALYRKSHDAGPMKEQEANQLGYDRISEDLNKDRGGDYLHVIYTVTSITTPTSS